MRNTLLALREARTRMRANALTARIMLRPEMFSDFSAMPDRFTYLTQTAAYYLGRARKYRRDAEQLAASMAAEQRVAEKLARLAEVGA